MPVSSSARASRANLKEHAIFVALPTRHPYRSIRSAGCILSRRCHRKVINAPGLLIPILKQCIKRQFNRQKLSLKTAKLIRLDISFVSTLNKVHGTAQFRKKLDERIKFRRNIKQILIKRL